MNQSRFTPCPDTPNCVSSKDRGTRHYIEPLRYTGDMATAKARLLKIVQNFQRSSIIEDAGAYIRVSFTSRIFRFTDDVEFHFEDAERLVHVKSASRTGYYDFGVNRRRCERIRKKFGRSREKYRSAKK